MDSTSKPQRQPFKGSCHCGSVKYVVFLTVPHRPQTPDSGSAPIDRIYRCNCRICHKSGFLHLRPPSPVDDFALLSPLDPAGSLGDYQCHDKLLHFFFCKVCAVRCFIFMGEGGIETVNPKELGMMGESSIEVWKPKRRDPDASGRPYYLSVNGHTIDAGQEGFDMRELVDNKSVFYYDFLQDENEGPGRYGEPHPGGCY